jgi:hypothetical protein
MTGVAVAAGVASAAIGAGASMAQGASSKKAAGAATAGLNQAGQQTMALAGEAASQSNAIQKQQYLDSLARIYGQGAIASGILDPYAQSGINSINQINTGLSAPHGAIAGQAATGVPPDQLKALQSGYDSIQAQYNESTRQAAEVKKVLDAMTYTGSNISQIQNAQQQYVAAQTQAEQLKAQLVQLEPALTAAKASPYRPAVASQAAAPAGGNLIRPFTGSDYSQSPFVGGSPGRAAVPATGFDPAKFANPTGQGASLTSQQIQQWLSDHPGATDEQIVQGMQQYGVSAPQMAAATGVSLAEINKRIAGVIDPSTAIASVDPVMGAAPPDLTKNFDQNAYLAQGGMAQGDLVKPFDQAAFMKSAGISNKSLASPYDPTSFLASGSKTTGDMFRNFTMADYQEDPGYQFRLDQGNTGINNSAAAAGGLLSGATLKAIDKYNSNMASQEYGNAVNRFAANQALTQNANNANANQYYQGQQQGLNALNTNQNMYLQGQQQAGNALNNAYNYFGLDRQNASNVYDKAYSNYNTNQQNAFNKLYQMTGLGQNSATNQADIAQNIGTNANNAGTNYANNVSNTLNSLTKDNIGTINSIANNNAMLGMTNANTNNQMIGGVANSLTDLISVMGSKYNPTNSSSSSSGVPSNYNMNFGNFATSPYSYGK